MSTFCDVMDRVGQLWVPGIDRFYAQFNPDPWAQADNDLAETMAFENRNASDMALLGFEARKRKLIDLYKQFLDLQEKRIPMANAFMRGFNEESALLRGDSILCDCCKKSVSQTKSITLRMSVEMDELGDPRKVIRATCASCAITERKVS